MTDRSDEPPFLLDGHHVVRYAFIDKSVPPPSHFSVVAGGVPLDFDNVDRMVIAEDMVKGIVFLMHCDTHWATVAAETFSDADAAQRSAEALYAEVKTHWHRYRTLTE